MVVLVTPTLATRTLVAPSSREVYTLYVKLRPPGFSAGGSQVTEIVLSVVPVTRTFLGREGGTVVCVSWFEDTFNDMEGG